MLRRHVYLQIDDGPVPDASRQLERDGYAVVRSAFSDEEVAALRTELDRVYGTYEPDVRQPDGPADERADFRYEMCNRSALCQQVVGDRRILDVIEPLLGQDCHVIANTAWRNPPRDAHRHGGGNWHIDAGPHVPRPPGVAWNDEIPYPVFAIGTHLLLQDCTPADGPTAVIPGSHRSGQAPPFDRVRDDDLTHGGVGELRLTGRAGDLVLFVSDVWHRRSRTASGDAGRLFLQIHYGRRDLAQRLRPTGQAQLSEEAIVRARAGSERDRTVVGLHRPFFYDG